ncbi:uncharacterized protein LOC116657454 isoform X2 [Camelus ferus]|uniref:Uncharacterized protein LOC116657454 isoform X2 n=1 Tax=Camelus ferus TaxID=419612 RepID=A0A8B8RBS9_CAMFR|nr:uncharacterized protein LOC116657454 isoform X2 [Camelus ferus]XP_032315429.1 uncharacterized protein LOC116657454 isoform X2 [Camelus ferus]XP_032315430.1 uncharacterized protein LOC116657454 isoform X2 [Camelus ferus]XP_032315431.1 uncharacterized protein LOC116657454 isoform X2 [Camelus ferus]XP_032315432.1 uncharacterized protein LOC116657454 isoform X2 [Camelus ferus]
MQGKLSAEVCEVGLLLKILNISPPGPSRGLGIAGLELGRKEEDVNLLLTSPHRQWEDQRPWGQRASGLNPGSTTFCLCDLLNPVSLSFPTCHQAPCGGPSLQNTRSEIKPGPWAAPCCSSPAWPCLARPSLLWELPSLRWGHRTPPGSCEELKWQDKWDILSHAGFEDTSGILGLETSSNPAEMVAVELAGGQNKELGPLIWPPPVKAADTKEKPRLTSGEAPTGPLSLPEIWLRCPAWMSVVFKR